jgi:hypothetical protein
MERSNGCLAVWLSGCLSNLSIWSDLEVADEVAGEEDQAQPMSDVGCTSVYLTFRFWRYNV